MATKAAAQRFFAAHDGEYFTSRQVQQNGNVWEPGPRKLTVGKGTIYHFDNSRFEIQKGMVVTNLTDTSVTFNYGPDWNNMETTYTLENVS